MTATQTTAVTTPAGVRLDQCDLATFPAFLTRLRRNYLMHAADLAYDLHAAIFDPTRSVVATDAGQIIGTASSASRTITIPGATLPAAAVHMVSVAPTHRRRGILTAMTQHQLATLHEHGDPVAILWASEGTIYGRFGYGIANHHAVMTGDRRFMQVHADIDVSGLRMSEPALLDVRRDVFALYDQVRRHQVGWLDRTAPWWDYKLHDPFLPAGHQDESWLALCHDEAGALVGYTLYAVMFSELPDGTPECSLLVSEIVASTPRVYAAIWKFLLGLDWVRHVRRPLAPLDEPLQHIVTDPRSVQLALRDGLWLRLVDVGHALASRRYAAEIDMTISVQDTLCPWNARTWQLTAGADGAACEPTRLPADLSLTVGDLGAAYLGSTSLLRLACAGHIVERTPGALTTLSRALLSDTPAFCPECF